ncbi:hypothetical protein SDC9_62723 [bioreactor metagenome]|uniref:Uncharacterized protein n=1 Tax=bioreactor metagenome TaxID=1076179 RepID=A0A644XJJ4_9ZZZZ
MLLELLQRAAGGLRHDPPQGDRDDHVDHSVEGVGEAAAEVAHHRREGEGDDRIDHPHAEHGGAVRDATDPGGEHLAQHRPDDRPVGGLDDQHEEAHRGQDEHRGVHRRLGAGGHVGLDQPGEQAGDGEHADGDQGDAGDQDLAAAEPEHQPQAEGGAEHRHHAVGDLGGDGGGGAQSGVFEDLGGVVHHRVDAGGLVADGQQDADHEQPAHPRGAEDVAHRALGQRLLAAFLLDHLVELIDDVAVTLVTHPLQRADRLEVAPLHHVPARRLGHRPHADPQRDRRDAAQQQHQPPGVAVAADDGQVVDVRGPGVRAQGAAEGALQAGDVVPGLHPRLQHAGRVAGDVEPRPAVGLVDHGVEAEGEQLADDDHQLVDGDDGAADALRCGLGQVDRDGRRGTADGEAEDEAERVHHPQRRGQRGAEGADQEDHGQHQDVVAAPVTVGEPPADQRAERGTDQQRAADQALLERVEVQAVGGVRHVHVRQGTGDHAGVIAEQQRSERRHRGDRADRAALAGGRRPLGEPAQFVAGDVEAHRRLGLGGWS